MGVSFDAQTINLISALGALIGGFAAAGSVLYAARSLRLAEEEKLIDRLKIIAVETNSSLQRIDRSLNWPLVLEISENFQERLSSTIGVTEGKEEFVSRFESSLLRARVPRLIALAVANSRIQQSLQDDLEGLHISYVEIGQRFPVSAHILKMCTQLVRNVHSSLTHRNTDIYDNALADDMRREFFGTLKGSGHDEIVNEFSSALSDIPMNYLQSTGQKIVDEAVKIFEVLSEVLASKPYLQLLALQKDEAAGRGAAINSSETITGDIQSCLNVIRPHMTEKQWDQVYGAVIKLEHTFERKGPT